MGNLAKLGGSPGVVSLVRTLVLVLAFALCPLAWAQEKTAPHADPYKTNPYNLSPELDQLLHDGWNSYTKREDDAAKIALARAIVLAQEQKNSWGEGEAHRVLGLIALRAANYPIAQLEFDQALSLFEAVPALERIARVHQGLGAVASLVGKSADAVVLYRKALAEFQAIGDLMDQAGVLQNLAMVDVLPEAEKEACLEQGLALANQLGNKDLAGAFLHSMGDHLFAVGNYAAAIEKLNEAATMLSEAGDRGALASVWTSLGRLYRAHGAYDDAIATYEKGLRIQQELGDKLGVIQSLNAMAISYGSSGHSKEALEHYEQALSLARETGSPRAIAFMAGNLGGALIDGPNRDRGIALLEEALRLDANSIYAGNRYMQLSGAYRQKKQFDQALTYATESVRLTRKGNSPVYLAQSLQTRARILRELARAPEALADIQEAIHVVEAVRTNLVAADYFKQGYASLTQGFFEDAIELQEELGQHQEAMVTAEEARARAFLDLLATRELQQQISADNAAAAGPASPAAPPDSTPPSAQSAENVRLTTRGAHAFALDTTTGKLLLPSDSAAAPPAFDELVATAKRLNTTTLSYWTTPDKTLVWVLRPDGTVRSARLDISSEQLAKLVRSTSYAGEEPAEPEKSANRGTIPPPTRGAQVLRLRGGGELALSGKRDLVWRDLYQVLIAPIRDALPPPGSRVTIVPQGVLFRLSFAALQDRQGHYLVESYALNYAPSLAVLRLTGERKKRLGQREPRYLILADPQIAPDLSKELGLPPLPGARVEARNLTHLLPRGQTTVLMGAEASKQAVLQQIQGKTVVHLATHAIVSDDHPFASYLVLSANGSSASDGGRLTEQEIYGMDLQTDLVVLSACRTALGKVSGDGMQGLTRAFFYGGSASVMATLWDVADEPTSLLISNFYSALLTEHDKSRALRTAQLRLLRALRAGRVHVDTPLGPVTLPENPVFWAGFVLQGEP